MPFNFHVGLPGPFSYNRRVGGGAGLPRTTPGEIRANSRAADQLPDDVLRVRNQVDWMLAVVFALVVIWVGSVWTIGAGVVVLAAVGLRHWARARKRSRQ